jgi:hypothetical protein
MTGITRREFLALGGLSLGGLAFRPADPGAGSRTLGIGRVTVDWIGIYAEPSFRASRLHKVTRDTLLTLLNRLQSDAGPSHNPIWYQVLEGYVHSGHLQLVGWNPQPVLSRIPIGGALFEVAVPYTRSYRRPDVSSDALYRLYFKATTWVTAAVTGTDGRTWYEIFDDLVRIKYYARSEHLRMIPTSEIAPISPEVPLRYKRIEVDLSSQEMFCYEHQRLIFRTRIASGIPDTRPGANGIPTITPSGRFFVEVKMPSRHMGDGRITSDPEAYELPGVPWVSFFTETGVAFHGTYWHNDFGRPKSHGCINMASDEAKWLYRWTLPVVKPDQTRRIARGTPILIS